MNVYFIKSDRYLKVGKAKDVESRMAELQVGNPVKLHLFGIIKCKSERHAFDMESRFHNWLKRHAHRGEWFNFNEAVKNRVLGWMMEFGGHGDYYFPPDLDLLPEGAREHLSAL